MYAEISTGAVIGIRGYEIALEVHLGRGMVSWQMVGLPEGAVKESKVRVQSALQVCHFSWPLRPITVNLAPANIKKDGSAFDLPMALAILGASHQLPIDEMNRVLSDGMVVGELGLSGDIRGIKGVLPIALAAQKAGYRRFVVPYENADEAAWVEGIEIIPVKHLSEVVEWIYGERKIEAHRHQGWKTLVQSDGLDMADVKGQEHAKRAMEIAAAGGHNLIMVGPPGSGKTMLAKRLPTILPPLSFEEALEVMTIYSVTGLLSFESMGEISRVRPFRAPHHTISDVGLIGGGPRYPRPGEVSLAHRGVLFLDELPEFRRKTLEVLRQPLENGKVQITRRNITVEYPSQIMLVSAMNPCPCGYLGSTRRKCTCRRDQIEHYRHKISGPLLDRIDLQVEVNDLSYEELKSRASSTSSKEMRARVMKARAIQEARFKGSGIFNNGQMRAKELKLYCVLKEDAQQLLGRAVERLGMSARSYDRILKVSRTVADLEGSAEIQRQHIAEAISYRFFDRGEGQVKQRIRA